MTGPDLSGYVTVSERLGLALDRWPELRIQCGQPQVVELGDSTYLSVTVTVWRTPDDPLPAIATAWERWPGRSPFTRDSEMMNAETSALGRALGLLGVGISRSMATSDEVLPRRWDEASGPAGRPSEPRKAQLGSRTPASGDKPATDAQVQLLRKMAAERGITLGPLHALTAADASREIAQLKEQGVPK